MREELDAIPRDGSSVCLPTLWVERAMTEVRTVLRLQLGDDFTELTLMSVMPILRTGFNAI